MEKKSLLCFFLFSIFMSCGILPHKNNFNETQKTIELGVVGIKNNFVHKTDFEESGVPVYKNLIKVSVVGKRFKKNTYNQYLKAVKNKKVFNSVNYIDSLKIKPTYFEISINDKVAIVNAINNDNISLYKYMKNVPETKIILSLRLTVSKLLKNQILKADAFYLTTDTQKKQRLYIYKNQIKMGEININKNDVFAYKTGSFCWRVTDRKKIQLATIIEEGKSCDNSTKKNAIYLEKELTKSTFKF